MMLKPLRNAFISGLLLLAPIGVTFYVIKTLVENIGAPASRLFFAPFLPHEVFTKTVIAITLNLLATLIVLILITLLGWFSKLLIGKFFVQVLERFLMQLPLVKPVYNTVKQIVDTFSSQKKAVFQKVVLVEFPRKGIYAIGFITGEGKGEIQAKTPEETFNIFVPTTPNPTSGFLIMAPKQDIIEMQMTVPDGMKWLISGGVVMPLYNPETGVTENIEVQNPETASTLERQ